MSPEAQRMAIAEACGWTWLEGERNPIMGWPNGTPDCGRNVNTAFFQRIPNYPTDLNAMHEAEKVLLSQSTINQPKTPFHAYFSTIHKLCRWPDDQFNKPLQAEHWAITATATQRAEAFLRTLNLWDDTK